MSKLSIIVAMSSNHVIGANNTLPWHLTEDLKYFKSLTTGHTIIMGRKTYQSIGKALPGRFNIVLSRHAADIKDVTVVGSLPEAIALTDGAPEIMIIGGARVFEQALPMAQHIYLTLIHSTFDADVYFPKLDECEWHCTETIERPHDDKNSYNLTFYRYERDLA